MPQQRLRLLGSVQVSWEEGSPPRFRSQRTVALLGYLVAEARPFTRDHLAALFWPDEDPSKGKANLRRELHNLAQILPGCWQTSRVEAVFVPGAETAVDTVQFRQYEAKGQWQAAADLISGNFLEGIVLADNLEFETWLLGEQERWRQRAANILQRAIDALEKQGAYPLALRSAQQLLQLFPWREDVNRQVMLLMARLGDYNGAIAQYERFTQVLAAELGLAPDKPTQTLNGRIRALRYGRHHNLPPDTPPLVGRKSELAQISEHLAEANGRLLTLVGPGGIGKTRLAIAAAHQNESRFLEGVAFIHLATLLAPDDIVAALASKLNLPLSEEDRRPPRQQLIDYLARKEILILLDNFEQLLDSQKNGDASSAVSLVVDILQTAPQVQIVVTSRERLHLQAEQIIIVQGLTYPATEMKAELETYTAVQLFLQTAKRIQPTFTLEQEDNRNLSAQICRQVAGMPLAIELAAAWVDALPLADITAEIQHNLDFLAVSWQDIPTRHRSARAMINTSWKYLSENEKVVFAQLSVFRDGFTNEAFQAIILDQNGNPAELSLLSRLVNKSLLQYHEVRKRYQLHELLRQFGAEKLAADREMETAVSDRHSTYFCAFLADKENALKDSSQSAALAEIESDIENSRAAWVWSVNQGKIGQLAQAMYSLGFTLTIKGRFHDGANLYRLASEILSKSEEQEARQLLVSALLWQARLSLDRNRARELAVRIQGLLSQPPLSQIETWPGKAFVLFRMGRSLPITDTDLAPKLLNHSLSLFRADNDWWGQGEVLGFLGYKSYVMDNIDKAINYGEQSLGIKREIDDQIGLAISAYMLAEIFIIRNQLPKAESLCQECLNNSREMNFLHGQLVAHYGLGVVSRRRGQFEQSLERIKESLLIAERLGDTYRIGTNQQGLSRTYMHLGHYESATNLAESALENSQKAGAPWTNGTAYTILGSIALAQKNDQDAAAHLQKSVAIIRQTGIQKLIAEPLCLTSIALLRLGKLEKARESLIEALAILLDTKMHTITRGLAAAAQYFLCLGMGERAIAVWAMLEGNSLVAQSVWFDDLLGKEITQTAQSLPDDTIKPAKTHTQAQDVWEMAWQLQFELSSSKT